MTKVVHCKKDNYDIYIGRPSKYGNPYSHLDNTLAEFKVKSRKEAIEKYREWILRGDGRYLLNDIEELRGKILGCWCSPKACHGDVLIEILNERKIGFII
jgi:hypothetical protein